MARTIRVIDGRAAAAALTAALMVVGTGFTRPQVTFKASLTATVIIQSGADPRKNERAATTAPATPASNQLGCTQITLQWAELTGARRYVVYVAARTDGPWSALPTSNVCGRVQWRGATLVTDVEPTAGAASVIHRVYYKVFAIAGAAPDAPAIGVTDPVAVELP